MADPNTRHLVKSFQKYLKLNDLAKIYEMLDDKATLSTLKQEKTFEPFVLAIKSNNLDLFDLLLAKGFPLSGTDGIKFSKELVEAVKLSSYEAVSLLVNLNVNVNSTNYKQIPLQIAYNQYSFGRQASFDGSQQAEQAESVIRLLIQNRANPNIYNQKGLRMVHQITLDKDYELLKLLIDTYQDGKLF